MPIPIPIPTTITKNDIQIYLTCLDPKDSEQLVYSQSVGGHISSSYLYPKTTFLQPSGLYDTTLSLASSPSMGDSEYLSANGEIIQVEPGNPSKVISRGVNKLVRIHLAGDEVYAIKNDFFNDVFNDSYKQYRCIAIVNNSTTYSAYNVRVGAIQTGFNPYMQLGMAIEYPSNQYLPSRTSTSSTFSTLVDTSLIGEYEDNHFKDAILWIGSSQPIGRVVGSFDSDTGTFTFLEFIPSFSAGVSYWISPGPCQRLRSGIDTPAVNARISNFIPVNNQTSVSINILNTSNGGTLAPKGVVYIWFERFIQKGTESFQNNSIVLNIKYNLSE